MAYLFESELAGTFSCEYRQINDAISEMRLELMNFSDSIIVQRNHISTFSSLYSENWRIISLFVFRDADENHRGIYTEYEGVTNESRVISNVASSGVEVAFFMQQFPPPRTIMAKSYFLEGGNRLMKLCFGDSRIRVIRPRDGLIPYQTNVAHRTTVRYVSISRIRTQGFPAGMQFVYVTEHAPLDLDMQLETVEREGEIYQLPRCLIANLEAMYPNTPGYPDHILKLMRFVHLSSTISNTVDVVPSFLDELREPPIIVFPYQLVDILVAAIDILSEKVRNGIFRILKMSIDRMGSNSLKQYAVSLRFI